MDAQNNRPSSIPRLSRLPLPRTSIPRGVRPSPSSERLEADPGINVSRLRRPSRDHLSAKPPYDYRTAPPQTQPSQNELTRRVSSHRPIPNRKPASRLSAEKDAPQTTKPAALMEEREPIFGEGEQMVSDLTKTPTTRRKARPSLSERTLETLAQIPSPSPARSRSGFVPPQSPMGPPVRPASALSSTQPSSSHGSTAAVGERALSRSASPTKQPPPPVPRVPSSISTKVSSRTLSGLNTRLSITGRQNASANVVPTKAPNKRLPGTELRPQSRSTSPIKAVASKSVALGSKKARSSIGAFRRSSESHDANNSKGELGTPEPLTTVEKKSRKVLRSSLSLRETIAMAKKAARNSNAAVDGVSVEEPGFKALPTDSNSGLLQKRVQAARTSGQLNVAAMGLRDIPDEVMKMYEFDPEAAGEWYESVDLIKFVAADNEMETIREDAFSDAAPEDIEEGESEGLHFRGVETLDLHGNLLRALPTGFRRLQRLRVLNLSNNKLNADAFPIISQMESLVELKIANNGIGGDLPEGIVHLRNLEVLDIHDNLFEALPESLGELKNLRVINLAQNKISSIPFDTIAKLPLTEIVASKNLLDGTLMPPTVNGFQSLRILDVRNNNLTALSDHDLDLPNLQQLMLDFNRISSMPDLSSWKNLLTLTAEDNKLPEIPNGFAKLSSLRNADFTGNELKILNERIALMDNLNLLRLGSNPLRDRKFLNMNTEDLKRDLRGRIGPETKQPSDDVIHGDSSSRSPPASSASSSPGGWSVKQSGILDRSSMQMATLEEQQLRIASSKQDIKSLVLHHNLLTELPSSLHVLTTTLTMLDLSHNKLQTSSVTISLPYLKSLNLSSNSLTSTSLVENISAPLLAHLDVTCNRLTTLPRFRTHFPELVTLIASDNTISDLEVEAVRGLRVLNVSGNDIGHLPPKLGLLGDTLRSLEVGGNRFRVPRYNVLEKGTEAVLAWLRDRIPPESVVSEADSVD